MTREKQSSDLKGSTAEHGKQQRWGYTRFILPTVIEKTGMACKTLYYLQNY
jgi:hypothetical protein